MTQLKICNMIDKSDDVWVDINRIVKVFLQHGVECSLAQAYDLWTERSNHFDANWLSLPDDDEILMKDLNKYCEIEYLGSRK